MQDILPAGPRWYVISLRPRGQHARLRDAARRAGHGFVALSAQRLLPRGDAAAREALAAALACPLVLFTSPAAVRTARGLARLDTVAQAIAVGTGTARALGAAGVAAILLPDRMDSEGVLSLPALQAVAGRAVGLVTAPGGRDLLGPGLAARGALLRRADVYERLTEPVLPAALARLRSADGRWAVALSSGEALDAVLAQLPGDLRQRLLGARVLAASERLAAQARVHGFTDVVRAAGPMPVQLVAALNRPPD